MPTVLIVDDDKHTRALLERILHHDERIARRGVRIVQAGDGVEGLKLFDTEKPDVVITDLLMPRMDGFRFCKELRARADHRPLGLLVLSGVYRDATVSARLRDELGASLYTKPYQIKELVIALDRQLGRIERARGDDDDTARVDAVEGTPPPVSEAKRGRFADTSLGRVLLDLHEERATGTLELRRSRVEKRIDLVVGHPVAVTSNQRGEMLGQFLVLRGVISERVHQQALERAANEEKRLGEALAEMGVLSAGQLVKQLTAQARFKITRSLRWPDGEWAYRPNRELLDTASKGNALDPVAVVFLGLKKTASIEEAAASLAPFSGRAVTLTARGEKVKHTIARVFGDALAGALSVRQPVERLLAPPFETSSVMPALEALLSTGCVADAGLAAPAPSAARKLIDVAEPPNVEELSGAFRLPLPPPPMARQQTVYDQIFADEPSDVGPSAEVIELAEVVEFDAPPGDGVPDEIPLGDSSVIEISAYGPDHGWGPEITITGGPEVDSLRDALLTEYLRLQGKDPYAVLQIGRDAGAADVEAAYAERMALFSLEKYEKFDIGPDHGKLEEVHSAYRRAIDTLATPEKRAALGIRARTSDGQMMAAELAFRAGERRMVMGNYGGAVEHFRLAVDSSPDVADYQASLGWAHHCSGVRAGDAAAHLAQALAIDPDNASAHEYLGRMLEAEGRDDEGAAAHLESALEAKPPRLGALEPLEAICARRGELAGLERLYRSLLRREADDIDLAPRLWRALGRVYTTTGDRDAARTAYQTAARLAPSDPTIIDALAGLATTFDERSDLLRARWRLDPSLGTPLRHLFEAAQATHHHDAAFLCAATLCARGFEGEPEETYRRYRPRFLIRAMGALDRELWATVRHPDDDPELGALFAVLAAAGQTHAPVDLDVRDSDLVADADLPEPFARVRAYVAQMLGVPIVPVARRDDFGGEAHLGALPRPILLVGPDTLASTDRVDLAFRLGRSMTFLWPGRAFAGSRPARVLKDLFIAAVHVAGIPVVVEDATRAASAARALAARPRPEIEEAGRLAGAIATSRTSVNLSSWSRALARSADRMGLVLCGDPAVAAAAVRVLGGEEATADLLDFALSRDHQIVRDRLGVSIEV